MSAPALELNQVWFRYADQQRWALRDISLTVEPGEWLGVVGPAAAGKTTFCHITNGLIPHYVDGDLRGDVRVLGQNLREVTVGALAGRVGLIFQDPESQIYGLTVEEEVAFGLENQGLPPDDIDARLAEALRAVGLEDLREKIPYEMSGGQKQRLVLADVLALRPSILVLDEPTAELDPEGKEDLYRILDTARREQGLTIILVEQDLERLARYADRILHLDDGVCRGLAGRKSFFVDAPSLARAGLHVPQVLQVTSALRARGWGIPPTTDAVEAAEALAALATSEGAGAGSGTPAAAPVDSARELVRAEAVEFTYPDGTQALKGVSFSLHAGQLVAVTGPNGSGKSTLARLLNGLLRPSKGRVTVLGRDTRDGTAAEVARHVAYVFQNPNHQIFSMRVIDEVAAGPLRRGVPKDEAEERARAALDELGLSVLADEHPVFLRWAQRQLLAIAAYLTLSPEVFILDEPTRSLDARELAVLRAVLGKLKAQGRAVVVITHDMPFVADEADRVLTLHDGQLIFDGPPCELFYRDEVLQAAALTPPPVVTLARLLQDRGRLSSSARPMRVDQLVQLLGDRWP